MTKYQAVQPQQADTMTGYPSIDKPWLRHYTQEELAAPPTLSTVFERIWQNNRLHPKGTAIMYYGKKISYRQLFSHVDACAKSLKATGVQQGDCVAVCSVGTPEVIVLMLACNKIGAVINFINPLFSVEQMTDRINETQADLLFVLDKFYEKTKPAIQASGIKHVTILSITDSLPLAARALMTIKDRKNGFKLPASQKSIKIASWQQFLRMGQSYDSPTQAPYAPDTPAVIVYSSGSTGASKGIVLTNDGINATINHYLSPAFPYTRKDSFLQMVPLWFSTGIVFSALMPLALGITLILELKYSAQAFTKASKKYKPNMTMQTKSFWVESMHSKVLKGMDLSFMHYPITGGEALLPKVEKEVNDFLAAHKAPSRVLTGWGMCELGSTVTATTAAHGKTGSVGFPIKGVTVAAFDPNTKQELPYGQRGELWVDSPARMQGYFKNEEATAAFFHVDEQGRTWGRTGDIGFVDEDGDVFVSGRASHSYRDENGDLVYLFDIEHVILQDENVADCKVVVVEHEGIPIPVAHIILEKSASITAEELVPRLYAACCAASADHVVPQHYRLHTVFPAQASGKLDTDALKRIDDGYLNAKGQHDAPPWLTEEAKAK